MQHTFSIIVLFIRFATPFCCRVQRTILCLTIPSFLQNTLNSFEPNSKPLSVLCFLDYFSIMVFQSLNVNNLSLFHFKKNVQFFFWRNHQLSSAYNWPLKRELSLVPKDQNEGNKVFL